MNIIIIGGTIFAQELAKKLKRKKNRITLVVEDKGRALEISNENEDTNLTVICQDISDPISLENIELETCDVFVAATDREETNILLALYAKNLGIEEVLVKVVRQASINLLGLLGLIPINSEIQAASNTALQIMEPLALKLVGTDNHDFVLRQMRVEDYPNLIGKRLGDLEGHRFAVLAVYQDEHIYINADTVLKTDAVLILLRETESMKDVSRKLKSL